MADLLAKEKKQKEGAKQKDKEANELKLIGKIRCTNQVCLQWIQNALNEAKSDYKEIGRPLTLRMHDGKYTSLLDSAYDTSNLGKMSGGDSSQLNMSGITNLLVILLVVTNIKNILINYKNYGFTLADVIDELIVSKVFDTIENYESIAAIIILFVFVLFSYWIEKLAAMKVN